jgi:anti-sigma factor RsiW
MDCNEFLSRYSDYDDSLLPKAETARFRAHMEACASCARYDRVLRKGRMLARQARGIEPSEDFAGQLHFRLWREARRDRDRARRASRLAAGLAAVTVLAVSAAGVGLLDGAAAAGSDRPAAVAGSGPWGDGARAGERIPAARGLAPPRVRPSAAGLPVDGLADASDPRPWGARRVDRRIASSYSPLVTGPPAYRAPGRGLGPTITLRSLD